MNVQQITDLIYKAYGTDTGILFGIKERKIVESIIRFAIQNAVKEKIEESIETDNNPF